MDKEFKKGEFLLEYEGTLLTEEEALHRENQTSMDKIWLYYFQSKSGIVKWYVYIKHIGVVQVSVISPSHLKAYVMCSDRSHKKSH